MGTAHSVSALHYRFWIRDQGAGFGTAGIGARGLKIGFASAVAGSGLNKKFCASLKP